jgi:hypothetical protein
VGTSRCRHAAEFPSRQGGAPPGGDRGHGASLLSATLLALGGTVLRRLTAGLIAQLTAALVMLIWGVASDALRDLITGFLSNISFGG